MGYDILSFVTHRDGGGISGFRTVSDELKGVQLRMFRRLKRTGALALAAAFMIGEVSFGSQTITATQPVVSTGASTGMNGSLEGYVNSGPGTVGVFAEDAANNVTIIESSGSAAETVPGGQQGVTGETETSGAVQTPSAGPGVQTGSSAGNGTQTSSSAGTQTGTSGQVNTNASMAKPEIHSTAAALYDATTGQFLYEKEGSKAMYPASITKLMTALLAVENLSLDDTVTYSASATQNLESGAANINLTTGDKLSVKDSLYALLLKSACEVANGLGEKVSGSQEAFAEKMNQRARELGCTGTHFENASGLNGASHYTTAKDMALIANAAISNDTIRTILQTRTYKLPASIKRGAITITNGNKMINPDNTQYYEGILGGKTGYTSKAGNTLAEAADISGHRLVAVVMKSNNKHYDDIKALFDYGKALIGASGTTSGTTTVPGAAGSSGTTVPTQPGTGSASGMTSTEGPGMSGTTTPDQPAAGMTGGPGAQGSGFVETSAGTQYVKADGSICKNEWLDLDGKSYFFDGDGIMCTGWIHFANDAWYYFNPETGEMVRNKWITDSEEGKSYYVGSDGVMARNTVIDGTYRVNEDGEYVEKVG